MARNIIISEEQYSRILKEGVTLNADVAAAGGDVKRAVDDTKREAQKSGLNLDDTSIQIKASETNEGKLIKKSDIQKNRLKVLKEHSELYSVKDFFNNISKKKLNEDFTNKQMQNMLGIYDDDMLNAAVQAEDNDDLAERIWYTLSDNFGTNSLRKTTVNFSDVVNIIENDFGFKYQGADEENEVHVFSDGTRNLYICPKMFYPKQGTIRIENLSIY